MELSPKEYADLKFEAAVSENRAIATEIRSELDQLETLIKSRPGLGWLIGIAIAIVAAIIGVLQFGGSQFSGGYSASSAYAYQLESYRSEVAAQVRQASTQMQQNTARLENIESLLIQVIDRQAAGFQAEDELSEDPPESRD